MDLSPFSVQVLFWGVAGRGEPIPELFTQGSNQGKRGLCLLLAPSTVPSALMAKAIPVNHDSSAHARPRTDLERRLYSKCSGS